MKNETPSESASWILAHPEDFTEMELHLARGIEQLRSDLNYSVCYAPGAIRDSFDSYDDDNEDAQWAREASDEQLQEVADMIIDGDPIWRDFHRNIEACVYFVRTRKE